MREDIKLWIKQFALESTGIHIDETISLLDPRNGLMPRDLIVLFFELQKHYKIKFVEQDNLFLDKLLAISCIFLYFRHFLPAIKTNKKDAGFYSHAPKLIWL